MATPDLIIVGAGSAGCVLANRMTDGTGLNILLIEAGGEATNPAISDPAAWPTLQKTELDWDFATVPQPQAGGVSHPWPRGKVVGGSSAIHAMGHMRGHRDDFAAWVDQGAVGWDYESLIPYFARSETSPFAGEPGYGADGPTHLIQPDRPHPLTLAHCAAGAVAGLSPLRDHNGGQRMDGPTVNTLTIRDRKRQSAADAYLTTDVRNRASLTILTNVTVDRLLFGSDGSVSGVRVLGQGTWDDIVSHRGVVLAAGSICSPMILMRSGIGPAEMLAKAGVAIRHDVPGVGANLSDHLLGAGVVYRARRPVPATPTQHSESLTYIHASGQSPDEAPDLVVGCVTTPVVSEALSETRNLPAQGEGYSLLFGITHPRSRGYLRILSPDPHHKPEIDPRYLSAPEDVAHFEPALEWARKSAAAPLTTTGARKRFCPAQPIFPADPHSARSSPAQLGRTTTPWAPAAWAWTGAPWSPRICASRPLQTYSYVTARSSPHSRPGPSTPL